MRTQYILQSTLTVSIPPLFTCILNTTNFIKIIIDYFLNEHSINKHSILTNRLDIQLPCFTL